MTPISTVQNLKQLSHALEPGTLIKLEGTNFSFYVSEDATTTALTKLGKKLRGFHRKNRYENNSHENNNS